MSDIFDGMPFSMVAIMEETSLSIVIKQMVSRSSLVFVVLVYGESAYARFRSEPREAEIYRPAVGDNVLCPFHNYRFQLFGFSVCTHFAVLLSNPIKPYS